MDLKEQHFFRLWGAQLFSNLGSAILSFALALWVYEQTGSPAHLGYLMFAYMAPQIYLSLFGGHFVDRWPKKILLISSDIVQGLGSLIILWLYFSKNLGLYFIVLITFVNGFFSGIQSLIFLSSLSSFVSRERLLKFNGHMQIFNAIPSIVAPLVAWPLLQAVNLSGLVALDIVTLIFSLVIMLFVSFPHQDQKLAKKFLLASLKEGFVFIFKTPSLKRSLAFFAYNNFLTGLVSGLVVAFIVEKVGLKSPWVAYNSSLTAVGILLGSLFLISSNWQISQPFKVMSISAVLASLSGRMAVVFLSTPFLIGLLFLFRNATVPILNACNDVIWQSTVPISLQGRAFGARRFVAQGLYPIGLLLGPMLVTLFESFSLSWSALSVLFFVVGMLETLSPLALLEKRQKPFT